MLAGFCPIVYFTSNILLPTPASISPSQESSRPRLNSSSYNMPFPAVRFSPLWNITGFLPYCVERSLKHFNIVSFGHYHPPKNFCYTQGVGLSVNNLTKLLSLCRVSPRNPLDTIRIQKCVMKMNGGDSSFSKSSKMKPLL